MSKLWFDVGVKRYTTCSQSSYKSYALWFDVGVKRYTTIIGLVLRISRLWFDVGVKRYTTIKKPFRSKPSCGLM